MNQVWFLVSQQVHEDLTLHLREGDLDSSQGQVARVVVLGRLLDLLLHHVGALGDLG